MSDALKAYNDEGSDDKKSILQDSHDPDVCLYREMVSDAMEISSCIWHVEQVTHRGES